jgi:hypothetical protein
LTGRNLYAKTILPLRKKGKIQTKKEQQNMGTIQAPELVTKWTLEQLTEQMAIGQTLQHLVMLHQADHEAGKSRTQIKEAIAAINITLTNLRNDIDALIAYTGMPPDQKLRRKPGRPAKRDSDSKNF